MSEFKELLRLGFEFEPDTTKLEPWMIDKYIDIVKANNEKLKKFQKIADQRKGEIDSALNEATRKITKENDTLLTTLNLFAKDQADLLSTKTQYKWESLSGNVIIKKALPKLTPPNKEKYDAIKKQYPEFVEEVKTDKILWSELKKSLKLQDGKVYDGTTYENVTGLFNVEVSEERTEIK